MTEELEKCPFCGSDEVEVVSPFDGQLSDYGTVKCYKCECHGPLVDMVGGYWKPIKAWNTRAALQSALDASQSTEPISFVKWEENGVRLKTRHHEFIVTTPPQVKAETVDLDAMRDHFEKWMTANGDYPHLIHKHFGGNYLREETSMKWDGFKQGVKYAQR